MPCICTTVEQIAQYLILEIHSLVENGVKWNLRSWKPTPLVSKYITHCSNVILLHYPYRKLHHQLESVYLKCDIRTTIQLKYLLLTFQDNMAHTYDWKQQPSVWPWRQVWWIYSAAWKSPSIHFFLWETIGEILLWGRTKNHKRGDKTEIISINWFIFKHHVKLQCHPLICHI